MKRKEGQEEIRWAQGIGAAEATERVRDLVASERNERVRTLARIRPGGERGLDVAREMGYPHGGGITHVVKGLELQGVGDKVLGKKLEGLKRRVSSFKS